MTYALIKDGAVTEYPIYEGDIQLRFPNTSFTVPFIPPDGYVPIADAPMPAVRWDQNVVEGVPTLVDDTWTRSWLVSDASPEQIASRTESKAAAVRNDRNNRLTKCDWTQLPDAPVDHTVWATYRQQLRDVSKQAGFPWQITWPVEP